MAIDNLDPEIRQAAGRYLEQLEAKLESDVTFFSAEIFPGVERLFRDVIEAISPDGADRRSRLTIVLNTPGGSVKATEKLVRITRHHYESVNFIVPDSAMSADWTEPGTGKLMLRRLTRPQNCRAYRSSAESSEARCSSLRARVRS
jgi:hypothetical protein